MDGSVWRIEDGVVVSDGTPGFKLRIEFSIIDPFTLFIVRNPSYIVSSF